MPNRLVRSIIYVILLALALFILLSIFMPDTIADTPLDIIDAEYSFTYDTGTSLTSQLDVDVQQITLATGQTYTKADIASATDNERGAIEYHLFLLIKDQLTASFDQPLFINFSMPHYTSGRFVEDLDIQLTSEFFDIDVNPELSQSEQIQRICQLIDGSYDMGALIGYHYALSIDSGWNITYVFDITMDLILDSANTPDIGPDNKHPRWILENPSQSHHYQDADMSLKYQSPTTQASSEDIHLTFLLDTSDTDMTCFTETVIINTMNITPLAVLPPNIIDLRFVPSDGIRLFVDSDLLSWDVLNTTITQIKETTIPLIEKSSFNQELNVTQTWDSTTTTNCTTPYNISHMDNVPPIKSLLTDMTSELSICNITSRGFFGLLNAGAESTITADDLNFGRGLEDMPYDYTNILQLPKNITLDGLNTYEWNDSTPIQGTFESPFAITPPYNQNETNTVITIDIKKMDLDLAGFLTGNNHIMQATTTTAERQIYVTIKPSELSLSEDISLDYLNADALRLCFEEQIMNESQQESYIQQMTSELAYLVAVTLGEDKADTSFDSDAFSTSLSWDKDITHMRSTPPLNLPTITNTIDKIPLIINTIPPQLIIDTQTFNLTGDIPITYKIIYPKGIDITATDTHNKTIIKDTTSDGRKYIEVTYNTADGIDYDLLSCTMNASPLYILGLFLPFILILILLIVLIAIVLLLRKKKGRRPSKKNDPTGYESEDFYVPPPPES